MQQTDKQQEYHSSDRAQLDKKEPEYGIHIHRKWNVDEALEYRGLDIIREVEHGG